jgi:hypothetical protein
MGIDADGHRSDILGSLGEALAGPLSAGARTEMLKLNELGRVTLEAGLWEPMLLVAPMADLAGEPLVVTARVGGADLPQVTFAPWTEARAFLPLFRPDVGASRMTIGAEELTLHATLGGVNLPENQLRDRLLVQLLSGSFGRLFYLLQAETPRLRRLMRQVANARALTFPDGAEGAMLDRIGKELAVPRFSDRIAVTGGQIVTEEQREGDAEYRSRLGIYRPFLMSTRAHVEGVLNADSPPGKPRFRILEEDNAFQIALRLVSMAESEAAARNERLNYQRYLRETVLIDPTADVPVARKLPAAQRDQENALRARLRGTLSFSGASRSMAPALAAAFDRLGIAAAALGVTLPIDVLRAQQDDGGSRWELGLAAEIKAPTQAKLDELADKARTADLSAIVDRKARSLVARLIATVPASAGSADWLFGAAGFRTLHPLAADRLMLSHFTTEGLVIEGPTDLKIGDSNDIPFSAALLAPNDEATNAALAFALAGGADGWPGGSPPWSRVAEAQLPAEISALKSPPPAIANRLRALGLATDFDTPHFNQALARYGTGLFALMRFAPAFSAALANGEVAAWDRFGLIIEQLARSGVASAALMRGAGNRLTVVLSAIVLPLVAANLSARRSSGFVWRALPVTNGAYHIRGAGSTARFTGRGGMAAIAVVSYARRGGTDPFEYRVTAADDVMLDIAEYEFLMNQLRHMTPAGVQANTWDIRRRNVVTNPGAGPTPLPPSLTRSFRPFRRVRFADADAPPVPTES